jgi:hypothetical protein
MDNCSGCYTHQSFNGCTVQQQQTIPPGDYRDGAHQAVNISAAGSIKLVLLSVSTRRLADACVRNGNGVITAASANFDDIA